MQALNVFPGDRELWLGVLELTLVPKFLLGDIIK
jgi:hypothetical protein